MACNLLDRIEKTTGLLRSLGFDHSDKSILIWKGKDSEMNAWYFIYDGKYGKGEG